MYNQFMIDAAKFDDHLSIDGSEERVMVSTGLNKQTIKTLGEKIINKLITDIQGKEYEQGLNWFVFSHTEEIFVLHALFSFYRTISGISTDEKWWLRDFKASLYTLIDDSQQLSREQEIILASVFSQNKYLEISTKLIEKLRESITTSLDTGNWDKQTAISTNLASYGSEALNFLRAQIITKHLLQLWNTSKTKTSTQNQVMQITQ